VATGHVIWHLGTGGPRVRQDETLLHKIKVIAIATRTDKLLLLAARVFWDKDVAVFDDCDITHPCTTI